MNEIEKVKKTAIYRFLGSKVFFQICAFLVLVGLVWFVWFYFAERTESQNQILTQLVANNTQVSEMKNEITELKDSNLKLFKAVCVLQDQIESLGATPAIARDPTCPIPGLDL